MNKVHRKPIILQFYRTSIIKLHLDPCNHKFLYKYFCSMKLHHIFNIYSNCIPTKIFLNTLLTMFLFFRSATSSLFLTYLPRTFLFTWAISNQFLPISLSGLNHKANIFPHLLACRTFFSIFSTSQINSPRASVLQQSDMVFYFLLNLFWFWIFSRYFYHEENYNENS